MLKADYTGQFARDLKRAKKRRLDINKLRDVMNLVIKNDADSLLELKRRHRMHSLHGEWKGSQECHVANAGDWLLVWQVNGNTALFLRTGKHDEIF